MKKISKKRASALLVEGSYRPRSEFNKYSHGTSFYSLSDERLLLCFDNADHCLLCESEAEFLEFIKSIQKDGGSYILEGFPSDIDSFLLLVKDCSPKLQSYLSLPDLNFSYASVHLIDTAMRQKNITYRQFVDDLFKWLVPFCSACVIHETKANWKFIENEENGVVEPHIDLPDGRTINVFIDLYEDAMENFATFSILSTIQLRLHAF